MAGADPAAEPSEEQRRVLRSTIHLDRELQGGGFTLRDGKWMIWLAVVKGQDTTGRPRTLMGYPVVYEDSGPFFADRTAR